MRRIHLIVMWWALFTGNLSSQVIYVSTLHNDLFRLDIRTCALDLMVRTDEKLFDISFHPDGTLYGITPDGELMRVDTNNGNLSLVYDFPGFNFNSLTASAEGVIYAIGSEADLWSYDLQQNHSAYLGNVGYPAAGDLTFRQGQLYMAASGDRIIRIPLQDPSGSSIAISGNISKDIFGIVSYAADCDEITSYAITDGRSEIYSIDFTSGSLDLVCKLPVEVSGGASTYEFLGSSEMMVSAISLAKATCDGLPGSAIFEVSGGNGLLQYSIDGVNYFADGNFNELAAGDYTLYAMDSAGCTLSYPFSIALADGPSIDYVLLVHETCHAGAASITIQASGGAGPLRFSLEDGPYQSGREFTGLTGGAYTIAVMDQAGCVVDTIVQLISVAPPSFAGLEILDTRCDSANGSVIILGANGAAPFKYGITGLPTQTNNVFSDLAAGNYIASVTDRYGCVYEQHFTIEPSDAPAIEDLVISHATCGDSNGTITVIAMDQSRAYEYSMDGLPYQPTAFFTGVPSGDHTLYMKDFDGCIATRHAVVSTSQPIRINAVLVDPATCGQQDGSIMLMLDPAASAVSRLNGHLPDGNNAFTGLAEGAYALQVSDATGCTLDSIITVPADLCPIYIPNVFSPNGDGHNDFFALSGTSGTDVTVESYAIYDRWGSLLYSTGEFLLTEGDMYWWDGTSRGEMLATGVYAYHIRVRYATGESKVFTGDVTILK